MAASEKSIGIFGGTFDPVHNGHLSIAESFLDSGYIDELWVLLSPYPPHKRENGLATYEERLRMLRAIFEPLDDVSVSDVEHSLPKPSYSVQTLAHLTSTYPDYTFYFCMGKDSFYSFTSWQNWEKLLDYCTLLVADRPIHTSTRLPEKLVNHMQFIEHDPVSVSSTEIRDLIREGKSLDHLVPSSVLSIIKEESLYQNS